MCMKIGMVTAFALQNEIGVRAKSSLALNVVLIKGVNLHRYYFNKKLF